MEETETLERREEGPTPRWIEVGKQPGPNPQEELREETTTKTSSSIKAGVLETVLEDDESSEG
jgi:hypothetical protein